MIGAAHPFVYRPIDDPVKAADAAQSAADEWGWTAPLDPLGRVAMNALFRCDDAIVRVGHTSAPARAAHELASVLDGHGIPVVAPVAGCATDRDDYGMAGWEYVPINEVAVDWEVIGQAVAQLHQLSPDDMPDAYPIPSPRRFEWWRIEELLGELGHALDRRAAAGMRAAFDRHVDSFEAIDTRQVVCHGDVHPWNVIAGHGGPLLIDWDLMCWAHPAWDHAMLLTYASRWGGPPQVYQAFASGYGTNMADDPTATGLGELRNLVATLMTVRVALTNPDATAEARRRLRYWRGDSAAPQWQAR